MNHTPAPSPTLTTLGDIAFADCGEHPHPLFRVNADVPAADALPHASALLHLAKQFSLEAALEPQVDRYAWAAHYLGEMARAAMDDVHAALAAPSERR